MKRPRIDLACENSFLFLPIVVAMGCATDEDIPVRIDESVWQSGKLEKIIRDRTDSYLEKTEEPQRSPSRGVLLPKTSEQRVPDDLGPTDLLLGHTETVSYTISPTQSCSLSVDQFNGAVIRTFMTSKVDFEKSVLGSTLIPVIQATVDHLPLTNLAFNLSSRGSQLGTMILAPEGEIYFPRLDNRTQQQFLLRSDTEHKTVSLSLDLQIIKIGREETRDGQCFGAEGLEALNLNLSFTAESCHLAETSLQSQVDSLCTALEHRLKVAADYALACGTSNIDFFQESIQCLREISHSDDILSSFLIVSQSNCFQSIERVFELSDNNILHEPDLLSAALYDLERANIHADFANFGPALEEVEILFSIMKSMPINRNLGE